MKRKTLALVLSLCMALSVSSAAFAEEGDDYKTTAENVEIIPVRGYVGPDTHVIPPDPEEPELEIYVEVPTKVLFAAFEADEGAVTSPTFTITNLSATSDVKVEIEHFEQRQDPALDLNGNLSLKLIDQDMEDLVTGLFPSAGPLEGLLTANLSKVVDGSDSNTLTFMIGGTWSGSFDEELKPTFDMTIKFSAAE